jgi:hypothetical protein
MLLRPCAFSAHRKNRVDSLRLSFPILRFLYVRFLHALPYPSLSINAFEMLKVDTFYPVSIKT